jgi:hypothetical protein
MERSSRQGASISKAPLAQQQRPPQRPMTALAAKKKRSGAQGKESSSPDEMLNR